MHANVSAGDATIVYLACTCWDADFMEAVVEKLRKDAPLLQWVISTENLETVSFPGCSASRCE